MICPSCRWENPPGANYCGNCGTSLASGPDTVSCPNCRETNPSTSGFCHRCGATLRADCPNCGRRGAGAERFCLWCEQLLGGPPGVKAASLARRVAAYLLDVALVFLTLVIGYLVWLAFSMRHGQTPAKQLLGIRVIRADGSPSDWGWTFVREVVVKSVIIGFGVDSITFGLGSILDGLWAFWDRDRQAIHDKIVKTLVVDDRQYRSAAAGAPFNTG